MVAMSDKKNESNESNDLDLEALESEVLEGFGELTRISSKSGWDAIMISMKEMPGEGVEKTVGALFSGGPVTFTEIRKSLDYMKLGIIESTETFGGVKLDDLSFGEWMELLEKWANT